MATPEFGTLETVDLREAWPHEAHNFTPWLADNLDRLSDAIGIPLEPEGTEVQVEQFSADIFARNPQDDSFVLIENQLEASDHTHLGQILTYLAGLEARTVIWVARDFQEAHLSAIRWLNENTTDPVRLLRRTGQGCESATQHWPRYSMSGSNQINGTVNPCRVSGEAR